MTTHSPKELFTKLIDVEKLRPHLPYACDDTLFTYVYHVVRPRPGRLTVPENVKFVTIGFDAQMSDACQISETCNGTFENADIALPYLDDVIEYCNTKGITVIALKKLKISTMTRHKLITVYRESDGVSKINEISQT